MTRDELNYRLSPNVHPADLMANTTWMSPNEWAEQKHITDTASVFSECEAAVRYAAQDEWAQCAWCIYAARLLERVDNEQ